MARSIRRDLDQLRLPDLQQRFREVMGQDTRCPNRTFLVRKILEALEAQQAAVTPAPEPLPGSPEAPVGRADGTKALKPRRAADRTQQPRTRPERGRFQSMTVEQLQNSYLWIVGRPTGSTDRAYLIWKIREAEKGRVPIGPRETRRPDQQAKTDRRILPLRLDTHIVTALDKAWRAQGMKSRMELFRRALAQYLENIGAHATAALLTSSDAQ